MAHTMPHRHPDSLHLLACGTSLIDTPDRESLGLSVTRAKLPEEAIHTVPQPAGDSAPHQAPDQSTSPSVEPSGLGANEWLVEEMLEQYNTDPKSVPDAWVAYFEANNGNGHATAKAEPAAAQPTTEPAKTKPAKSEPAKAGPAKAQPAKAAAPATETAPARPAPEPKASSQVKTAPPPRSPAAEPAKGTATPVAKEPAPAQPAAADDEPTHTVLRGAPMRTAKNMDISLSVPTATSVRSVPVKVLWD